MARIKATFYLPVKGNNGEDLQAEIAGRRPVLREVQWLDDVRVLQRNLADATGEQALDTSAVYQVILEEKDIPELEKRFYDVSRPRPARKRCIWNSTAM